MQRRHDPTYYWATRRLPAAVRPATHALYGYVRTADEIVDGPRRAADAGRAPRGAGRLGGASCDGGARRSAHPVVRALVDAGAPPRPAARRAARLHALDARRLRRRCGSRSWEELEAYMDGSAGSVGRIMAPLLGVPGAPPRRLRPPRPRLPADELHPRRARGLRASTASTCPARTARASASSEADSPPSGHAELRALIAPTRSPRARALFAAAAAGVAAAPASVRPGIRLARRRLLRMLDRVEARRLRRARPPAPALRAVARCPAAGAAAALRDRRATLRGAERTLAATASAPTC